VGCGAVGCVVVNAVVDATDSEAGDPAHPAAIKQMAGGLEARIDAKMEVKEPQCGCG
jgi:hypothetical protein